MIIRKLDDVGDWTFGKGFEDYARYEEAIDENIKTRIQSWVGDCFFDIPSGVDWKARLDKGQLNNLTYEIKSLILKSYGVVGVNNIDVNLDNSTRYATITYDIQTIYSPSFISSITQGQ